MSLKGADPRQLGASGTMVSVPGPRSDGGSRTTTWGARFRMVAARWWLPTAISIAAALAVQIRWGYTFGFWDQEVLSLKGISWADSSALVNDWFTAQAPQPHWSFDVVTFVGEGLGVLEPVYFGYWLAGLIAFGWATTWLADHWLPRQWRGVSVLVGPVLVIGPISVLGSSSILFPVAIPHMLGGCLAYLCLAALITGRLRAAVAAALATGVVHVQHGANLAVVLVAAAVLLNGRSRRARAALVASAIALVAFSALVTALRGIVSSGDDFLEICRQAIPFHCDARTWPIGWIHDGRVVILLAMMVVVARWRRDWRMLLATVVLPAAGLAVGVWADRSGWPVLGELAQRTNVYRLVALVLPFAAWGATGVAAWGARRVFAVIAWCVAQGLLTYAWLVAFTGALEHEHALARKIAIALALITASAVLVHRHLANRERVAMMAALVAIGALVVYSVAVSTSLGWRDFHLGYDKSEPEVAVGLAVRRAIPPGAVLASPPSLGSLRLVSRRAIVADCKGVPFGGEPWREYKRRIEALGGRECATGSSYAELSIGAIERLSRRFGATHALFLPGDRKIEVARRDGWSEVSVGRILEGVGWRIFEIEASPP